MAETYNKAAEEYQKLSTEFSELNKEVNRAIYNGTLTDELELKFFKAEKALKEAYAHQQSLKIQELNGEGEEE